VISGVAGIDNYFTELVRRETGYFIETHNFIYVTGISMDSTLRFVDRIPNNSIVLVPNYQMDINMVSYSTPEVLGMIAQHSKAPVFMLPETFGVNKGGVGGYVFSYYEVGKETGRIAKQILNGTPIKDITVNKNRFYRYAYDWQELKKWGLVNSRLIPRNSTIYNEPWLLKYKKYALGMILFLGGIIMLVIYLIGRNKKLKMLSERILETEKMYRELIREDRMAKMTELTASLSHELNQPLTAILFSAQAGKRFLQSGKLDQAQAEQILDNIIEDDKRAGGIISSVRSLMKLEHREKEKVDLNEVIRETADIYHNDAVRQNIKMIIKCNAEKAYILADKIQLQQVLMNFIRNAEIAMENTDPANKKLEVISAVDKGFITVSVRDSGPGIDSAIKEKIFEPFVTTRKGGTGIGLALSRSIIEAHDGKIWAENLPDGGADFSFRLNLLKNG
jgi:signal transduction histidine kinase